MARTNMFVSQNNGGSSQHSEWLKATSTQVGEGGGRSDDVAL